MFIRDDEAVFNDQERRTRGNATPVRQVGFREAFAVGIVTQGEVWSPETQHRKLGIETKVAKHPIAAAGEFFSVDFDFGGVEAGDDERLDDLVFSELGNQAGHPACVVDCHLAKGFSVFDGLVIDDAEAIGMAAT